jgi:hypothetical protein
MGSFLFTVKVSGGGVADGVVFLFFLCPVWDGISISMKIDACGEGGWDGGQNDSCISRAIFRC